LAPMSGDAPPSDLPGVPSAVKPDKPKGNKRGRKPKDSRKEVAERVSQINHKPVPGLGEEDGFQDYGATPGLSRNSAVGQLGDDEGLMENVDPTVLKQKKTLLRTIKLIERWVLEPGKKPCGLTEEDTLEVIKKQVTDYNEDMFIGDIDAEHTDNAVSIAFAIEKLAGMVDKDKKSVDLDGYADRLSQVLNSPDGKNRMRRLIIKHTFLQTMTNDAMQIAKLFIVTGAVVTEENRKRRAEAAAGLPAEQTPQPIKRKKPKFEVPPAYKQPPTPQQPIEKVEEVIEVEADDNDVHTEDQSPSLLESM